MAQFGAARFFNDLEQEMSAIVINLPCVSAAVGIHLGQIHR